MSCSVPVAAPDSLMKTQGLTTKTAPEIEHYVIIPTCGEILGNLQLLWGVLNSLVLTQPEFARVYAFHLKENILISAGVNLLIKVAQL